MLTPKNFSILNYYQEGDDPKLLFHSGTHGDEYEVIPLVTEYLSEHNKELPAFVYIPEVSPSAVISKTRLNKNGSDLNRVFMNDTNDDEARINIDLHSKFKFDLCFDFHEDPEFSELYIYDSGKLTPEILSKLQNSILKTGVKLFSGVDDPNDPTLGFEFKDGYKSFKDDKHGEMSGTFWDWSIANKNSKRIFTIEIPGKLPVSKKRELVRVVFENLVIPLV